MGGKKIAAAAGTGANTAARHNHKPGNAHPHSANAQFKSSTTSSDKKSKGVDAKAKTKERDSPGKGKEHKPVADSHRQSSDGGTAPVKNTSRPIRELLSEIKFGPRGLVGEHMADYYHMEHILKKTILKQSWSLSAQVTITTLNYMTNTSPHMASLILSTVLK